MIENWKRFIYILQKSTRFKGCKFSQQSRATVWAEHPGFIPSSVTDSLQKLGENRALLSKMGIIIILSKQMRSQSLLINVCKRFEIPRRQTKCIIWTHKIYNNLSMD